MLDAFHTLRMFEVRYGLPRFRINFNAIRPQLVRTVILPFEHDSPYYYRIYWAVCNRRLPDLDQELQDSLALFQGAFGNVFYSHTNLAAILNHLARQSVQAFNENLAQNMKRAIKRMIELEINVAMNEHLPEDFLKKLANHIYKRSQLCHFGE